MKEDNQDSCFEVRERLTKKTDDSLMHAAGAALDALGARAARSTQQLQDASEGQADRFARAELAMTGACVHQQTLRGSFSAGSKPILQNKYS